MSRPTVIELPTAPDDEIGLPDDCVERCRCGVLFERGSRHRCALHGQWIDWQTYRLRVAYGGLRE